MREFLDGPGCLMEFLRRELDDPQAGAVRPVSRAASGTDCSRTVSTKRWHAMPSTSCAISGSRSSRASSGPTARASPSTERSRARPHPRHLRRRWLGPRGRATARPMRAYSDELVDALFELTRGKAPDPVPTWVTCVPSLRRPELVPSLAARFAARLQLPFRPVVSKTRETAPQAEMGNSAATVRQCLGRVRRVRLRCPTGRPTSSTTSSTPAGRLTVVASAAPTAGAGPGVPLALARSNPTDPASDARLVNRPCAAHSGVVQERERAVVARGNARRRSAPQTGHGVASLIATVSPIVRSSRMSAGSCATATDTAGRTGAVAARGRPPRNAHACSRSTLRRSGGIAASSCGLVLAVREPGVEHRDDTAIGAPADQAAGALREHQRGRGNVDRVERDRCRAPRRAPARAACIGSSGTGNGILSITTSTHATPAASIPPQNDRVPTSTDVSSSRNVAREAAGVGIALREHLVRRARPQHLGEVPRRSRATCRARAPGRPPRSRVGTGDRPPPRATRRARARDRAGPSRRRGCPAPSSRTTTASATARSRGRRSKSRRPSSSRLAPRARRAPTVGARVANATRRERRFAAERRRHRDHRPPVEQPARRSRRRARPGAIRSRRLRPIVSIHTTSSASGAARRRSTSSRPSASCDVRLA